MRKTIHRSGFLIVIVLCGLLSTDYAQQSDNWPQFRGPNGDGHSSAQGLPVKWNETENVVWKTPIHGRGWSSPVVFGSQIWLTSATADGRSLFAICIDRASGKVLKDMKLFDVARPQYAHPFNTYASPTPVIETGRVYITFGSAGTACIDTSTFGVIWERRDIECNHFRGAGSSPIVFRDLLIMHFDGSDYQYVIALDKKTGKTVWRKNRSIDFQDLGADGKPQAEGDFRKAFATPHIVTMDGRLMLISFGAKAAYAYDPMTGHEYWRVEERAQHSASTRPVIGHGLIFYPTGFSAGQLIAIKPDSTIAWRMKRGVPNKPSLLLVDDLLYMVTDAGIASGVDARSGEVVWQKRIGGEYSASPVYADSKVWFFSEDGKTTVLSTGRNAEVVGENQLGDGFLASPAIAGKAFFLRSRSHLYRVETR